MMEIDEEEYRIITDAVKEISEVIGNLDECEPGDNLFEAIEKIDEQLQKLSILLW